MITLNSELNPAGEYVSAGLTGDTSLARPSVLLHSCCGPCSTAVVEDLIHTYKITIYFYNPNITDREEYYKRLKAQREFIEKYNGNLNRPDTIGFMEGKYEPEHFFDEIKGLESEAEGGLRCRKCFLLRLEKTAGEARLSGFDCFATTLSVSPHKDYGAISEAGREVGIKYGVEFVDRDYKANGGYNRSVELSKKYSLYRQDHCGCEFSRGGK